VIKQKTISAYRTPLNKKTKFKERTQGRTKSAFGTVYFCFSTANKYPSFHSVIPNPLSLPINICPAIRLGWYEEGLCFLECLCLYRIEGILKDFKYAVCWSFRFCVFGKDPLQSFFLKLCYSTIVGARSQ
jgi:hypothetical protein